MTTRRLPMLLALAAALALAPPRPARASTKCRFDAGALPSETLPRKMPKGDDIPIDHILVLMQENRSFDHYFGRLKAFGVKRVKGLPKNASNPDADGNPVPAFHQTKYCTEDTAHSWNASHAEWNGGKNDGFVVANDPDGARAMGWYDESDLPFYYGLASTFAIGDHAFCSVLGPTFPNRFYLLSGTSDGRIRNDLVVYDRPSIFGELDDAGIEWRIYASGGLAFGLLLSDVNQGHLEWVKTLDDYYADAAAGTLPPVAFIDPMFFGDVETETDEHPHASIQVGQRFVSSVVGALIDSPLWERSALFVTYDEHGGFYDHVPPPRACEPDDVPPDLHAGDVDARFDRYGFRVPLIAVSPWAKAGYVSHKVHDATSILRFIQARFDLPALTRRDANARPPMELFDFRHQPRLVDPPPLPPATIDAARAAQCLADFPP